MRTQSPGSRCSSSSSPILMIRVTPDTSTRARCSWVSINSTSWPGMPRHMTTASSPSVLDRLEYQLIAPHELEIDRAARRTAHRHLLALPRGPAPSAVRHHREQDQLGLGVLDHRTHGGQGERLGEGVRMDVVETADPHPYLRHRSRT